MVLDFSKIRKEDVLTAGGKGANLGEMVLAGINVPKGFVVTVDAYREFLKINGLNEVFEKELSKVGKSEAELFKTAKKLRELIKQGTLPENIKNQIKNAYEKLGENVRVAVRSSATAEDLPDASFAGQQETYLNVRGVEEVLLRIVDCYASLWGGRAVSYRANQGYNQLSVAIAVVVQTMVESEKAGVLFTVNPVNENREEMQINASYGLGESVVSGRVTADSYIVDKSGTIISLALGTKETQIIYADRETKKVEVSKELKEKPALSEDEVRTLVQAGNAIEKHYGKPMDVEWAIRGGEVYILQAREITTLRDNHEDELVKAYLKGVRVKGYTKERYAFILEKMPFAYRALDYDYMVAINDQTVRLFAEGGIKLDTNPRMDDDGIETLPNSKNGVNIRIFNIFKLIKMMRDYDYCEGKCRAFMEDYEKEIEGLKKLDFSKMDVRECRDFIIYSYELTKRLCYDRFKYALFPSVLAKDLEKAVKKVDESYTVYDLYRNLDNKTAVVSRDVELLAAEAKKNEELKKSLISGESYESICKQYPDFKRLAEDFLRKNGFKSDYNCYCIDAKTFVEEPDRLLNIMKPLVILEDEKKGDMADFEEILSGIKKIYGDKFPKIKRRIEAFRYFHIVREESQYLWETLFYYVRQCVKRANVLLLGNEDFKAGLANLFFRELIETLRRGELAEDDKIKIEKRNKNRPLAIKVWEASKGLVFDAAGEVLKGVSGSRGVAVGEACLIKGPEEFYKMKKGGILVCHLTDPEWTPLFSLAGAVVADTGSALSHAAIVAREYGIPAVLGVGYATSKFKDGDQVMVDGDKGEARKA